MVISTIRDDVCIVVQVNIKYKYTKTSANSLI